MPPPPFRFQYRFFVVGARPFCLWDVDIPRLTLDYLDSIDPTYFEYVADTLLEDALEIKSQPAAMAIRATYSQALETLFAFLAVTVQAPRCVPAWMTKYNQADLRSVVDAISHRKTLLSQLVSPRPSWDTISDLVHTWLVLEDKEKEASIKRGFAEAWSSFASDFLNVGFSSEYNSIKHGLRAKAGGFHIAIGPQRAPGVPAPPDQMKLIGNSHFGSSFLVHENLLDKSHHLRMRRRFHNWNPEDLAWGLHIISMSVQNIISALRVLNGFPATDLKFLWPTELKVLTEPWSRRAKIGVTSMTGFDTPVPQELTKPFSKGEILEGYRAGKDAGRFKYTFPEDDAPAAPPTSEPEPQAGA